MLFALARRLRGERGQTSVEYVGVFIVACAIVAVLLNAGIGELLAAKLKQQIVAVATDQESGGGGSGAGKADGGRDDADRGRQSGESDGGASSGSSAAPGTSDRPERRRAEVAGARGGDRERAAPPPAATPPSRPRGDSRSLYEKGVTAVGVSPESPYTQRQAVAGATVGFVKGIAGQRAGDAVSAAMGGEKDATFAKAEKVGETGSWAGGLVGFAAKAGRKGFLKVTEEFSEETGQKGAQGAGKGSRRGTKDPGGGSARPTVTALTREQDAGFTEAVRDLNSRDHIFNKPEHNLGPLTQELGSQEAVLREAVLAVPRTATGVFETSTQLGRHKLTVRGRMVNRVPRIGTVFVPA